MPTASTRRVPWSVEDLREILAGTVEDSEAAERIRTPDRKGLSPVSFAAMRAAATTDSLLPLLDLMEPPGEGEKAKLDLVLDLLERIAQGQLALARRMDALEFAISGQRAASPTGSQTATVRPFSGR